MIVAVLGVPLDGQPERPFRIFNGLYRAIGCPRGGEESRMRGNRLMVMAADLQVIAHQTLYQGVGDRGDRNPAVCIRTR